MCGIAGIISGDSFRVNKSALANMSRSLAHRGPDGEAVWINDSAHAGLAHRRLAIIDLSVAAAQPMHFKSRYTIVYNGEIYNYIELKETLFAKGYLFRTGSDTEVILAMYDCYREKCLDQFDGMFAFAIWDEREQMLFCARDRFGEKPFFYSLQDKGSTFLFGSEMKALNAAGVQRSMNNELMLQFLANGYTGDQEDASRTFDDNIQKLPAAHYGIYNYRQGGFSVHRYWQIDAKYRLGISEEEAIKKFEELLNDSVKIRLRSDVPVGTSLSGGVDSSAIAAIISKVQRGMFRTFTASFPGFDKDESLHARDVADKCGFENYCVAPSADDLMHDLKRLIHHQEEPFTSASVYAQFRVFGLAKENGVTVLLDGQGADETLAGYDKYRHWHLRSIFPVWTASLLELRETNRLHNNKNISPEYVRAWASHLKIRKPVVRSLNDMLEFDVSKSGLEQLLRYADRNSMAHGREVRLPFLSHKLVEFVFSLPPHFKIRSGWTKWILRKTMDDQLPSHIVWGRKKIGFEPPQKDWMQQKEIQNYIRIAQTKLVNIGILDPAVLKKTDNAHAAYDHGSQVWRQLTGYLYTAS